jgi:hypothetical protein
MGRGGGEGRVPNSLTAEKFQILISFISFLMCC